MNQGCPRCGKATDWLEGSCALCVDCYFADDGGLFCKNECDMCRSEEINGEEIRPEYEKRRKEANQ
jgi:hypothetical protein